MKLLEPASDLAVVAALLSSVRDRAVPADGVFLGEVGLGGEVRPVGSIERRLAEAGRLGFGRAFVSARAKSDSKSFSTIPIAHVKDLANILPA
jgi:DNA repair protein RadA/Sms